MLARYYITDVAINSPKKRYTCRDNVFTRAMTGIWWRHVSERTLRGTLSSRFHGTLSSRFAALCRHARVTEERRFTPTTQSSDTRCHRWQWQVPSGSNVVVVSMHFYDQTRIIVSFYTIPLNVSTSRRDKIV